MLKSKQQSHVTQMSIASAKTAVGRTHDDAQHRYDLGRDQMSAHQLGAAG